MNRTNEAAEELKKLLEQDVAQKRALREQHERICQLRENQTRQRKTNTDLREALSVIRNESRGEFATGFFVGILVTALVLAGAYGIYLLLQ